MFQKVKGTNDFFPQDSFSLQYVMSRMAMVCQRYGYNHVLAPSVETIKLLAAKSGEDIKEQLFVLKKKATEDVALKFDLTVPMTRMFVSKQRELPKPVKWFSADRMWRYEAPQKGREREFFQVSVENFGTDKPESDAELVNMMGDCYLALGLKPKDFVLKINQRKLLEGILLDIIPNAKMDAALRIIDKSSRLERQEYIKKMNKVGINQAKADRIKHAIEIKGDIGTVEKKIKQHLKLNKESQEGLQNLKDVLGKVKHKNVIVDLSMARGLAYYTGCVFEAFDTAGELRALGGGGRYDQLVHLLGGEQCPASGFAIGYSTVSILLQEKKLLPAPSLGPDFFIVSVHENHINDALKIAHQLRTKYIVDVDLMRRPISKQFNYANSIGAKKVIVVGPAELKTGKFTVKDMKTGKEEKKAISDL